MVSTRLPVPARIRHAAPYAPGGAAGGRPIRTDGTRSMVAKHNARRKPPAADLSGSMAPPETGGLHAPPALRRTGEGGSGPGALPGPTGRVAGSAKLPARPRPGAAPSDIYMATPATAPRHLTETIPARPPRRSLRAPDAHGATTPAHMRAARAADTAGAASHARPHEGVGAQSVRPHGAKLPPHLGKHGGDAGEVVVDLVHRQIPLGLL